MINTITLPPFKRMCVTIGNLPSSFMESMSYYEALCWMYNYLDKTVIPAINTEGEAITELQNAFTTLKTYVDTYFENLDVQEEINNKLDEMAESGELTEIIAQYLSLAGVLVYNTVADMKTAENLTDGSTAKTLGYYNVNDKGGAEYKIRTITNSDVIDEMTIIALNDNTLIAELIIKPNMNINQFGAKQLSGFDNHDIIQTAINKSKNNFILEIPAGTYEINSGLEVTSDSVHLIGNNIYTSCIKLVKNTADVILNLKLNTSCNEFENIYFEGVNKIHTGIRIAGNAQDGVTYTSSNWKNSFINCEIRKCAIGISFTSDRDVLSASTTNFASENLILHCKFKNNKTHVLIENNQAVNNTFEQTDFENDTGEDDTTTPMIINKAGGGFTFNSCSIMGGADLLYIDYPNNGTLLFLGNPYINFNNCKVEIYNTNSGNIIHQTTNNVAGKTMLYNISLNNIMFNMHDSAQIALINYCGKLRAIFNNINATEYVHTFKIINQIINGGSNSSFSNLSQVKVYNSGIKTEYEKGSNSTGTNKFVSNIEVDSLRKYTSNKDAYDFEDLSGTLSYEKYPYNLNQLSEKTIGITQFDVTSAIDSRKFILPKGLCLTKLCLFKQGVRRTLATTINLYMVKNVDQWTTPGTFDKTTDAVLIATIDSTTNKQGYFEVPIAYNGDYGYDVCTGAPTNFTESRYYIEDTQTNKTSGIVAIKYY